MAAEVFQEMWCTECKFYMSFPLESTLNGVVTIICGLCKHRHQRMIKDGRVVEEGRYANGKPKFEIEVLRSACYPESRVESMRKAKSKAAYGEVRDAFKGDDLELSRPQTMQEQQAASILEESWKDRFGGRR
jgi:hypothetical protein